MTVEVIDIREHNLDNEGIDYGIDSNGSIYYKEPIGSILKKYGFSKMTDKQIEKKFGDQWLEKDNTYNYQLALHDTYNYGITETDDGGVVISFKIRQGGDVRGNYTDSEVYFKKGTKMDDIIYDTPILWLFSPETTVVLKKGDKTYEANLDQNGYIGDFTDSQGDSADEKEVLEGEDIWNLMEKYGEKHGKNIPFGQQSYQHGGVVQHTGMAKVHKGELIIPAKTVKKLLRPDNGQGGWFKQHKEHMIAARKGQRTRMMRRSRRR